MWFLFGFVTLAAASISSLIWRLTVSWHGTAGQAEGVAYEYSISTAKHGRVTGAKVGVRCSDGFSFQLKPEGTFDRWSKSIGLTKECQTGDVAFDQAVYVVSDDPAVERMLQTDTTLRDAIMRLMSDCAACLGTLKRINVHAGRLWIVVSPRSSDKGSVTEACKRVVPALSETAGRIERDGGSVKDDRDPFPKRAAVILSISTGLALNAAWQVLSMFPDYPFLRDSGEPIVPALLIGAGVVVLLAALTLLVLGHSARTHMVLLELVLVGSIGATISAYAELRDYDFDFDPAPSRVVQAEVTDRWITHGRKGSVHCHIRVSGWPGDGWTSEIPTSCDFYNLTEVGADVAIEEHAGALGWPWVKDVTVPR